MSNNFLERAERWLWNIIYSSEKIFIVLSSKIIISNVLYYSTFRTSPPENFLKGCLNTESKWYGGTGSYSVRWNIHMIRLEKLHERRAQLYIVKNLDPYRAMVLFVITNIVGDIYKSAEKCALIKWTVEMFCRFVWVLIKKYIYCTSAFCIMWDFAGNKTILIWSTVHGLAAGVCVI